MKFAIEDLQNNNPVAISNFVNTHKEMVFRTCMGYLQNTDDANDITQEVFINAIRSIGNYKANASLKTWLTRIAINLSLNHLRNNKKHNQLTDVNKAHSITSNEDSEADFHINQYELKRNLAIAIRNLPERQRKVFVLFHYNKISYGEIADITKDSEKAVESLLQRARKNLQKELSNFYKENFK